MVLLIAGPPVEVGVTMYVLSISSVSEVLMVQFAFSNSYRTHNELSRPFHFFLLLLIHLFPCPLSPLSPFFERVPSRVYLPTPQANSPLFFVHHAFNSKTDREGFDRSIDRVEIERAAHPTMPLVSDCLFRDYPIRARATNVQSRDSTNIGDPWNSNEESYVVINIRVNIHSFNVSRCVSRKKKEKWRDSFTAPVESHHIKIFEREQTWRQMWLRGISYARRNLEEFSARLQTCAKRRIGIAIRDIYVGSKGHIGTYINTHVCIHIAYIYVYTCVYTCIHIHVPNNTTHRGGKKTYIHIHIYTHDTPYTDDLLTYVFIARHSCLVGWTVTREPCYVPQSSQDIFLSTSFMVYGWLV